MIGIIGAMDVEVDGIKKLIENKKEKVISQITFVSGRLFGKEVVVAKCGIGKVFAALCTEAMINFYSPDLIINTGVAGSLCEELSTADVVLSTSVVQHDMDTSAIGDPVGLISGINIIEIPADKALADRLFEVIESVGVKCKKGIIASGDRFVADAETKKKIVGEFNAVACEMEGGAVGHVCYVNRVPFAVVRAISDNADGKSEMDYPAFAEIAAANSVNIINEFVRNY